MLALAVTAASLIGSLTMGLAVAAAPPEGRLVRAIPMRASRAIDAAGVYRIAYRSDDNEGHSIVVTGAVLVPEGRPPVGGWPIIAWAHGTTGVGDHCAPSRFPNLFYSEYANVVGGFVAAGFLVVAPDYPGIGSPGLGQYLELDASGRALVDSVRAARQLVPAAGSRWAVVGHSEGGQAALGASEIATVLAPELQLVGSVAIAPAANLLLAPPFIATDPGSYDELTDIAVGIRASDGHFRYGELLGPRLVAAMPRAEIVCEPAMSAFFSHFPTRGTLASGWDHDPAVLAYLRRNEPGTRPADKPILLVQGSADRSVPQISTDLLAKRLVALGDTVTYRIYPGQGHDSVVPTAQPAILAWVHDLFSKSR